MSLPGIAIGVAIGAAGTILLALSLLLYAAAKAADRIRHLRW